jgi:hypothetical protein
MSHKKKGSVQFHSDSQRAHPKGPNYRSSRAWPNLGIDPLLHLRPGTVSLYGHCPFQLNCPESLKWPLRLSPQQFPSFWWVRSQSGLARRSPKATGAEWYAAPRGYIRMGIAPRPTGTEEAFFGAARSILLNPANLVWEDLVSVCMDTSQ